MKATSKSKVGQKLTSLGSTAQGATMSQTKRSTMGNGPETMTGKFWQFIKEEIGIIYIYPEQKSYLKKELTFEERQDKIDVMLEKVHYDDDKLDAI
jgi:hypothetical protein